MRKAKKIGILIAVIFIIAAVLGGTYYMQSWPLRFRGEFDQFFGKGNWELISSEAEISRMYKVYYHASDPLYSSERKGTYHMASTEVFERMGQLGFSERTIKSAKKDLGIDTYRKGDAWYWRSISVTQLSDP